MLDVLMSPGEIGTLTLPNRIIMGSMHLGLEHSSSDGVAISDFYRRRAEGGVGLIITGGSSVSPEGASDLEFSFINNLDEAPKFYQITNEVHQAGGLIGLQLFHAGRYGREDITGYQPVSASSLKTRMSPTLSRTLTEDEILGLINKFGEGAKLAKKYGFDAVEIMGSEGYLINQFLSPITNLRKDNWGGHLENRMRFGLEIVKAIRHEVGSAYPIIFRMSGMDLMPESTTWEETLIFAKRLEEHGVDCINVGIGWHESPFPTVQTLVPHAAWAHVASGIKEAVTVPVIVSNRINNPVVANRLLVNGVADFVSMARPFLSDAEIVNKVKTGRLHFINTCIGCNQACLDHTFSGEPVSCMVNPISGRERYFPTLRTLKPKNIAVIGAGPAGLEAAKVLAERGHFVTLYEKENHLGGQFRLAAKVPGKEDYMKTISYYSNVLQSLNVNIHMNNEVDADELIQYDELVLATGVVPRLVDIPGVSLSHVVNYVEIFDEEKIVGSRVVIVGAGGIACDVAHFLHFQGLVDPKAALFLITQGIISLDGWPEYKQRNIHMLRRGRKVGQYLGKTTRWALLQTLEKAGVKFHTQVKYQKITDEGVWIEEQDGSNILIPADTIVIAAGQEENLSLLDQLLRKGFSTWEVQMTEPDLESPLPFDARKGLKLVKEGVLGKNVYVIGGARKASELDAVRAFYEGTMVGRIID